MVSPAEQRLHRFTKQFSADVVDADYLELYADPGDPFGPDPLKVALAFFHQSMDSEFEFMNLKAPQGEEGHFNADNSRNLIDIFKKFDELVENLQRAGKSITIDREYSRAIEGSRPWLYPTGGSPIPEKFTPIKVDQYDPVFRLDDESIPLGNISNAQLIPVGSGSFANVQKFVDPNYGVTIARKKLKKDATEGDAERFRREFNLMKELKFPYILEVYQFDERSRSYTMEYCDSTLQEHVLRRNDSPSFNPGVRKRIALQFLYGLNYLHLKGIFHRDISLGNILIKAFDKEAVTVKLSDFGLAKLEDSQYTRTVSEIHGTFPDPALDMFKNFSAVNDIYAVGFVLSFIFTGRKGLASSPHPISEIAHKCSHSEPRKRYQTVQQVVSAVEALDVSPNIGRTL